MGTASVEFLRIKPFAKRSNLPVRTVRRFLADGTLKGVRSGKTWYIATSEIERLALGSEGTAV